MESAIGKDSDESLILQWKPGSNKNSPVKLKELKKGSVTPFQKAEFWVAGLTFDHQGRLLICAEGHGRVIRIEKDGSRSRLTGELKEQGLATNPHVKMGPALDLVYCIDGSIYFVDAGVWDIDQKNRASAKSAVYRIARSQIPGPHPLTKVSEDCAEPGGLALSPKQDLLYVSDAARKNIRVHPIKADGSLAPSRVFAEFPSGEPGSVCGLKTDEHGNVYATGPGGLSVFGPTGKYLGVMVTPEPPSRLTWGAGFSSLYVAAGTTIYHVATRIPGTRTF